MSSNNPTFRFKAIFFAEKHSKRQVFSNQTRFNQIWIVCLITERII